MKKQYKKPAALVVELQHQGQMLQSSPHHVDVVKTNLPSEDVFDLGGEKKDGNDEEYFEGGGDIR